MAKKYFVAAFAALFLFAGLAGCSKEDLEAQKPVYLSIPDMFVNTNYTTQGTSNAKITTVWMVVNGKSVGAFELPAAPPVILNEGKNEITFYEGINLNGVGAARAIYEPLTGIDTIIDYTPSGSVNADTIVLDQLYTTYETFKTINILENFDRQGLSLEKTSKSDTNILKSSDTADYFINYQNLAENNGKCGVLYTTTKKDLAEVATINEYTLPGGGANVYLELNYRCNIPFTVGVITDANSTVEQTPTVRVNAKTEWNKIYINLVTEVSSYAGDNDFKIYFSASHPSELGSTTGYVFLDNIKLIYTP